jgi:hypothetical protein
MQSHSTSDSEVTAEPLPVAPYNSWIGSIGPVAMLLALLPVLVLFLAPVDVLDRYQPLRAITRWAAGTIPVFHLHADQSPIPQVVQLVDALVLVATLGIAFITLLFGLVYYRALLKRHQLTAPHPPKTYAVGILLGPLFAVVAILLYPVPGVITETAEHAQFRSATYAMFAFFTPFVAGLFAGCAPLFLRLFIDCYLFSHPVTTRQ